MARVVGMYALVLVGICNIFVVGANVYGTQQHNRLLTYSSFYQYDWSDIFMVDVSIGHTTQITDLHGINEYDWSSSGAMIAIRNDPSPNIEIVDGFGNRVTTVEVEVGLPNDINWMPNENTIVFELINELVSPGQVFAVSLEDFATWRLFLESPRVFHYFGLALSPDGMTVAFVRRGDLLVMDVNTLQFEVIEASMFDPAWSPDGRFIAYYAVVNSTSNIYVFDTQSKTSQQLTDSRANNIQPAWSPDGTQIAFASDRDGDYDICVMNADGSDVRQVTFNDVDDTNPAWVP